MEKLAPVDHAIEPTLQARWSPRAFASTPIEPATVHRLFEAARWAPSAVNEQPWMFIVGDTANPATHAAIAAALSGTNPSWASKAPVLVLALARTHYQSPRMQGRPNRHAYYDLGQAVAQLTVQATALGLFAHQMGGFDADRARGAFNVPAEYDPVVVLAIGYAGDPDSLPADLRARELAPRVRRPQSEFVLAGPMPAASKE